MASTLSAEQKALNKEARKARDRAYRERKTSYSSELESAMKTVNEGQLAQAYADVDQKLDSARESFIEERARIQAQIDELKNKLDQLQSDFKQRAQPIQEERARAHEALFAARRVAKEAVDNKYPDVAECYSAAEWKPIEDFLP